jgi:hypothetical protein
MDHQDQRRQPAISLFSARIPHGSARHLPRQPTRVLRTRAVQCLTNCSAGACAEFYQVMRMEQYRCEHDRISYVTVNGQDERIGPSVGRHSTVNAGDRNGRENPKIDPLRLEEKSAGKYRVDLRGDRQPRRTGCTTGMAISNLPEGLANRHSDATVSATKYVQLKVQGRWDAPSAEDKRSGRGRPRLVPCREARKRVIRRPARAKVGKATSTNDTTLAVLQGHNPQGPLPPRERWQVQWEVARAQASDCRGTAGKDKKGAAWRR